MKKLAVVVMMTAIATFMTAAMASADDLEGRTIQGKYAVTGLNSCLAAPNGFTNLTANGGVWTTGAESWEGSYTFMHNGTGAVDVLSHNVGAFPGSGGSSSVHWDFHYTVGDGGKITFTADYGSYVGHWLTGPMVGTPFEYLYLGIEGTSDGVLSPDGNHMFLTSGAPLILDILSGPGPNAIPVGYQLICSGSFVLFRLQNARD